MTDAPTPCQDETLLALEERVRFEALLSDLSATFVNVPAAEVDEKIEAGLKSFADFLGFERGTVFQFSESDGKLYRTNLYLSTGVPAPPEMLDDVLPHWVDVARRLGSFFMSNPENLPADQWRERQYCREMGIRSLLFTSLAIGGVAKGLISFVSYSTHREWPEVYIQRINLVAEIFANALARKEAEEKLHSALAEVERLKNQLEAENLYLRDRIEVELDQDEILGESPAIRSVLRQLSQVARTDSTVLITGETGTGKELVARAIHRLSDRGGRAMIKVNCAALPATLVESELFGREKGAYSGAATREIGRFEAADRGTIFLDEVGEIPLELQAKLLRVLQEGQFERLGSTRTIKVDVRVIAATNRNLVEAVREGRFRSDLYYRLNVFPIEVPPLRERPEDIELLTRAFVADFGAKFGKKIESIPKRTMEALTRHPWPGNVRELRNAVERAMILANTPVLNFSLPEHSCPDFDAATLDEAQRAHILKALERTRWRIRGEHGAAKLLNLKPTTLESKIKKLGLR